MIRSRVLIATTALVAVLAAACGSDDSTSTNNTASGVARTVRVEMRDNKYVPDTISVDPGETVRFVFTNTGKAPHDAYIGDMAAQEDHKMEMRDEMGGHGMSEDIGAVTVEPGATGELTHTFRAGDDVLIGCHEPGHFESGMRLSIDVG